MEARESGESKREQIFAGGDKPTEQIPNRGNSIFQLSPETSPGNSKTLVEATKSSYPYSPMCTPGGEGKVKGQCSSFKTQAGECKVAVWPPK